MALYKIVNGEQVQMSEQEEKDTKEGWAANEIIIEQNSWVYDRQNEYPTIENLIVAMWEKQVSGDSTQFNKLESDRQAIKTKYPKP